MGKAREGPAEKMVLEQSPGWTREATMRTWAGGCVLKTEQREARPAAEDSSEACWLPCRAPAGRRGASRELGQARALGRRVEQQLGIRTFSGLVRTSASTPGQRLAKQWLWPAPLSTSLLSEALGSDHLRASFGRRAGVGKPRVRAKCHPRVFSTKVSPYLPSPLHL